MRDNATGLEHDATATIGDMTLPRRPHFTAIANDAESAMYRFIGPLRAMIEAGLATGDVGIGTGRTVAIAADSRLIISGRVDLASIADIARATRVVIDIDEVPPVISALEKHLARADAIVVSTEALAGLLRDRGFASVVLPHVLDPRDWTARPRNVARERLRIGWYDGRRTVASPPAFRDAVVRSLVDDVDFVFLGAAPATADFGGRLHVAAIVPLSVFPAQLAALDLDLVLVPPADGDSRDLYADHLPALQAGILGYPVITADVASFRPFPVTRIASDRPAAWIAAIRERISDLQASRREVDRTALRRGDDRPGLRRDGEALRVATQQWLTGAWAERYLTAWNGTSDAVARA